MKKRLCLLLMLLLVLAAGMSGLLIMKSEAEEARLHANAAEENPEVQIKDPGYDPQVEGILSGYYRVDRARNFLTGIAPGTTAERIRAACMPEGTQLSGDVAATGAVLSLPGAGEVPGPSLTLIVTGDLNGDGNVSISDMLMIKSHLLGEELNPTGEAAGDINYDGGVTITDFLRIKAALLGMEAITAGRPADSFQEEPVYLLAPGEGFSWQPEAAPNSYFALPGGPVQVDISGNVTAGDTEGTGFVYAMDAQGKILSRLMVTVLNEKFQVSLNLESGTMVPGSTRVLTASFNHPLPQKITWSTSDPQVVSVSGEGELTAIGIGEAVITATLPNGAAAQAKITVVPPIESMELGKSLYKVKPGASRVLELITEPADVGEVFTWTSSDPNIATVSHDGTVTGVSYGTVTVTVTGKYSGLTASCQVKICDVKQVALTFDDGPSVYTDRLLDYLKSKDVKVTFFLVVNRLGYFEDETIREVQEGHEMGYHSYAHDMQTGLSSERITSDFLKSNQKLKELTGAEFTLWRAPGGDYNQRVLDAVPLPHIMWSLDTLDWQSLNAEKVCSKILGARDGQIVLIHDLHRTSVEGAIMAMDIMLEDDYEFVTVTELLSRDGTPPEKSVSYRSADS